MKNKNLIILKGLPESQGIAIGNSYVMEHVKNIVNEKSIKKDQVLKEIKKLDKAILLTVSELNMIKHKNFL